MLFAIVRFVIFSIDPALCATSFFDAPDIPIPINNAIITTAAIPMIIHRFFPFFSNISSFPSAFFVKIYTFHYTRFSL